MLEPNSSKALLRRSVAHESLGEVRLALADASLALALEESHGHDAGNGARLMIPALDDGDGLCLLYGQGGFTKTLTTAFNFGWDADNTAATAGTIIGIIKGSPKPMCTASKIP